MVKNKMLRISAIAVTSVGIAGAALAGVAGASANTVGNTGSGSLNKILNKIGSSIHAGSHNMATVNTTTGQAAASGNVHASDNTTVGDGGMVGTGDTANHNTSATTLHITNTTPTMPDMGGMMAGDGTIDTTGKNSTNLIVTKQNNTVKVDNQNHVTVGTDTQQASASGEVSLHDNTTVGSVKTGNASNTSDTSTTITIEN